MEAPDAMGDAIRTIAAEPVEVDAPDALIGVTTLADTEPVEVDAPDADTTDD